MFDRHWHRHPENAASWCDQNSSCRSMPNQSDSIIYLIQFHAMRHNICHINVLVFVQPDITRNIQMRLKPSSLSGNYHFALAFTVEEMPCVQDSNILLRQRLSDHYKPATWEKKRKRLSNGIRIAGCIDNH